MPSLRIPAARLPHVRGRRGRLSRREAPRGHRLNDSGKGIGMSRATVKAIVSCSGPLLVESKSKFPPVLILQGSKDKSNSSERVKAFEEKLKANETPYATH